MLTPAGLAVFKDRPRPAPHLFVTICVWLAAVAVVELRPLSKMEKVSLPDVLPGVFGVFYQSDQPTKNALERKWIDSSRDKVANANDIDILQKIFDRMK